MARKLSRKVRFEVLNRDGFTCRYCGRQPPDVVLHVDHIVSHAKGGSDEPDNLITSCQPCNSGKGTEDLKDPTPLPSVEVVEARAREAASIAAAVKAEKRAANAMYAAFGEMWDEAMGGPGVPHPWRSTIRKAMEGLAPADVVVAVEAAAERVRDERLTWDDAGAYFGGIVKSMLKESREATRVSLPPRTTFPEPDEDYEAVTMNAPCEFCGVGPRVEGYLACAPCRVEFEGEG